MAQLDDRLWRVICGDDTGGWRNITEEISGLTWSEVRPGGSSSASFAIHQSRQGTGYNELREGKRLRVFYMGRPRFSGVILPRPLSYSSGNGLRLQETRIEAAGYLEVAKRREDYARVFIDLDIAQWFAAERDDMSSAIGVETAYNNLKFVCPKNTVITGAETPYQEWWYWINSGMVEQSIVKLTFRFSSVGTMHWQVYETTDQPTESATWSALGASGAGATTVSTAVSRTCSANVRALAVRCYYDGDTTLTTDEYVKLSQVAVTGESGTITPASALTSVLVTTGLASSFSSSTVS